MPGWADTGLSGRVGVAKVGRPVENVLMPAAPPPRTIILKLEHIIGSGAYADVFRVPQEKLAYKLFASGAHPTNVSQGLTLPEDEHYRRKTFLSECTAYNRASEHPLLSNHVPQFFGPRLVQDVITQNQSVRHLYMLELCYALEFIEG